MSEEETNDKKWISATIWIVTVKQKESETNIYPVEFQQGGRDQSQTELQVRENL